MKYLLGYVPEVTELVQFETKVQADYESEEWVEVEANSLEEAKEKYEETFSKWHENQKHLNVNL